ncbi:MAG: hypothetical protein ABSB71_07875 [Candidatus Bathyarchaeia archaeon]|jgi:hypothetical protein
MLERHLRLKWIREAFRDTKHYGDILSVDFFPSTLEASIFPIVYCTKYTKENAMLIVKKNAENWKSLEGKPVLL